VESLTDDDLDVINGRQEQLEGKIQERHGLAKDEAKREVETWPSDKISTFHPDRCARCGTNS
jgi:uncharacterized protein YjbJ (UPF0337 family)